MKIWDIDQVCQNKQNVIILCWVKFLISNLDDKDDIKEGLLKRLKNIEKKNQKVSDNDKNKKTNDESELSSVKIESRTKTIREDELERTVYSPDVVNVKGTDILRSKMKHKRLI